MKRTIQRKQTMIFENFICACVFGIGTDMLYEIVSMIWIGIGELPKIMFMFCGILLVIGLIMSVIFLLHDIYIKLV